MGKHKGPSLFESYAASLPLSGRSIDIEPVPLPDSMRTSTLLEQIGKERSWSDEDIEQDIKVLDHHRLYYVRDLRALSDESWKCIELLPLVRDLLRCAAGSEVAKNSDSCKKEKKKKYKKPIHLAEGRDELALMNGCVPLTNVDIMEDTVSKDPETIRNTISNEHINATEADPKPRQNTSSRPSEKKSVSFSDSCVDPDSSSSSDSSSGSSNSADEEDKKPSIYTSMMANQGPSIEAAGPNRIKVRTATGNVYECDRFCPHKGKDLVMYGEVRGDNLICKKHNWNFSLDGSSPNTKRTINPCRVNDW